MKTKIRILFAFVLLSISLCLMSNTYSRYVANTTGNVNTEFAKWQILINNSDITSSNTSSITFNPIIEENNNIAANVIAPSSKGYFDIDIDPSNVDVSFNYSINLALDNKLMPDLIITKYAIFDDTYVDGTKLTTIDLNNNIITNTLNFEKNTENFKFKPFTIRVYFEWYEGENEKMDDLKDTAVANNNSTFTISATINFEQVL